MTPAISPTLTLKKGKFSLTFRVRKKKAPASGTQKPSIRTQEMGKTDLKKFLKRVSTPSGTKPKAAGVMASHDFNKIISKPHASKGKIKSKKSPIVIKSKRPVTASSSSGFPKSAKNFYDNLSKYPKTTVSPSTKYKPMAPRAATRSGAKISKAKKDGGVRPIYISRPSSSKPLSKNNRYSSQNTLASHTKYLRLSQIT